MEPDTLERCTYTYDPPDAPAPDDRIDLERPEPTRCPHPPADGTGERCLFHHGDPNFPVDRISEEFERALTTADSPPTFAGGALSGLDLADRTIDPPSGAPIDLRGATIDGDLDLAGATLEVPLLLDGAAITGVLDLRGATVNAPLSLRGTELGGRWFLHRATLAGGCDATDVDGGYLDGRALTADGPVVLTDGSFSATVQLARARIAGDLDCERLSTGHHVDATAVTVEGDCSLREGDIDGHCELPAAEVDGDCRLRRLSVAKTVDCSHASVGGDLDATDVDLAGDTDIGGLTCHGDEFAIDGATFGGPFRAAELAVSECSAVNATFGDEARFVLAEIDGTADFTGATFEGMGHLRDGQYAGDLILREVSANDQWFLAFSTIEGDLDCTDAHFVHVQLSATIHGEADFTGAIFDEKAILQKTEFGSRTWFDEATFAGSIEFTEARFGDRVTVEDTEFLVEPTFEDAIFARDPDLSAASFPISDVDMADRRDSMILARPETLEHAGEHLPGAALTGEIGIAKSQTHLLADAPDRTKAIVADLTDRDRREWHDLFEEPMRTARTAASRLDDPSEATLVFGLVVEPDRPGGRLVTDAALAAVWVGADDGIVFGHLESELSAFDYLIPVPGDADPFEAGPVVATVAELRDTLVPHEVYRAAQLEKTDTEEPPVNAGILPVLVGARELCG